MLYPREDSSNNALMFACRSCQYSEPATAACIYRNSLQEQIAETAGNVEDVAQDPTVGDDYAHDSATGSLMEEEDMPDEEEEDEVVPHMCTLCGQEITCPTCGQASDGGVALEVDDPDRVASEVQNDELVEREQRERTMSSAGMDAS